MSKNNEMVFSTEVIKQLQYYVYRLIDPRDGQTFYVGKGKGNRVFAHVNDALKDFEGEKYEVENEDDISLKIKQIREIKNSGLKVIHVIQRYGLTEKEAFEVEAAIIDCFAGLTNIQSGISSDRGVNNAEVLQRILSLEEFDDIDDLDYCLIKINNNENITERGSIYEAVRKHWKVNLNRIQKIPYVLAVNFGVVIGVFKAKKWYYSEDVPERCMFDGEEAESEIKELFINKRIPKHYMKKGMVSPVLYHDRMSKKAHNG